MLLEEDTKSASGTRRELICSVKINTNIIIIMLAIKTIITVKYVKYEELSKLPQSFFHPSCQSGVAEVVRLCTYIREVPGSNLGRDNGLLSYRFPLFSSFPRGKFLYCISTRPRALPSK
jgi:hypothetical protein